MNGARGEKDRAGEAWVLSVAAAGYIGGMVGAVLMPTFFGRTVALSLATVMMGALFIIGHDAAHGSFVPGRSLNRIIARLAFVRRPRRLPA